MICPGKIIEDGDIVRIFLQVCLFLIRRLLVPPGLRIRLSEVSARGGIVLVFLEPVRLHLVRFVRLTRQAPRPMRIEREQARLALSQRAIVGLGRRSVLLPRHQYVTLELGAQRGILFLNALRGRLRLIIMAGLHIHGDQRSLSVAIIGFERKRLLEGVLRRLRIAVQCLHTRQFYVSLRHIGRHVDEALVTRERVCFVPERHLRGREQIERLYILQITAARLLGRRQCLGPVLLLQVIAGQEPIRRDRGRVGLRRLLEPRDVFGLLASHRRQVRQIYHGADIRLVFREYVFEAYTRRIHILIGQIQACQDFCRRQESGLHGQGLLEALPGVGDVLFTQIGAALQVVSQRNHGLVLLPGLRRRERLVVGATAQMGHHEQTVGYLAGLDRSRPLEIGHCLLRVPYCETTQAELRAEGSALGIDGRRLLEIIAGLRILPTLHIGLAGQCEQQCVVRRRREQLTDIFQCVGRTIQLQIDSCKELGGEYVIRRLAQKGAYVFVRLFIRTQRVAHHTRQQQAGHVLRRGAQDLLQLVTRLLVLLLPKLDERLHVIDLEIPRGDLARRLNLRGGLFQITLSDVQRGEADVAAYIFGIGLTRRLVGLLRRFAFIAEGLDIAEHDPGFRILVVELQRRFELRLGGVYIASRDRAPRESPVRRTIVCVDVFGLLE